MGKSAGMEIQIHLSQKTGKGGSPYYLADLIDIDQSINLRDYCIMVLPGGGPKELPSKLVLRPRRRVEENSSHDYENTSTIASV